MFPRLTTHEQASIDHQQESRPRQPSPGLDPVSRMHALSANDTTRLKKKRGGGGGESKYGGRCDAWRRGRGREKKKSRTQAEVKVQAQLRLAGGGGDISTAWPRHTHTHELKPITTHRLLGKERGGRRRENAAPGRRSCGGPPICNGAIGWWTPTTQLRTHKRRGTHTCQTHAHTYIIKRTHTHTDTNTFSGQKRTEVSSGLT